jgi:hypothetical protein
MPPRCALSEYLGRTFVNFKTLRNILNWERCGSCARLGRYHFPPDRE